MGVNSVFDGILVINILELICLLGILILKAAEMDRRGKDGEKN